MTFIDDISFKSEGGVMKILKLRWRALLFIVVIATLLLLLYHAVGHDYDCKGPYWEINRLHKLNYYCNPLSDPVDGAEGQVSHDQFELISVHLVIRHGDRYNMHSLPNYENAPLSCMISEDLKEQVIGLKEYHKQMKRQSEKGGRLPNQTFHAYNLYPNNAICKVAQLTPEGVAQHLKNGQHLKMAYLTQWNLLSDSSQWDQILIRSTTKSRTFQSALALMTGLIGELDLQLLQIEEATNNSMCSSSTGYPCNCLESDELIDLFSCTFDQLNPDMMARPGMHRAYSQIAAALSVDAKSLPRPSHIMDLSMVHFCHHLPLPHQNGHCVQPWAISDIFTAVNQNGANQHLNENLLKIVRLKMQPLMYEMAHRMNSQLHSKTALKFVLYSGHDSTVEPLADAMGFSSGTWPRYASRIITELYKGRHDGKGYIRVLYDGKPVTELVNFCQGHLIDKKQSLCPLQYFIDFVNHDNIRGLNEESYEKACQNVKY